MLPLKPNGALQNYPQLLWVSLAAYSLPGTANRRSAHLDSRRGNKSLLLAITAVVIFFVTVSVLNAAAF